MAGVIRDGQTKWGGVIDSEGHRTYMITHLVKGEIGDGPATILNAIGLPTTGATWFVDNDVDLWAFCLPNKKASLYNHKEGEPHKIWKVESTFSTRPVSTCRDLNFDDPLTEPDRTSGSFVKYTQEVHRSKDGTRSLETSSHELFRGPGIEFDNNRPIVAVHQNVFPLGLSTFTPMIDTVNDAPLWGLPARCIKLSNVTWDENFYGVCQRYYTRTLEFDIDFTTFDRDLLDYGNMAIRGEWRESNNNWNLIDIDGSPPVATNPNHFWQYKDRAGNPAQTKLNGSGIPLGGNADNTPEEQYINIQYYSESNFLTLGIPITIGI